MRRMTLAITALLLGISACSSAQPITTIGNGGGSGGGATGALVGNAGKVHLVQGALVRFQACDDFLSHVKAEAIERVGPYGLEWYGNYPWPVMMRGELAMEDTVTAAPSDGSGGGFSTTNNQEIGVDEADIVKTDGERIVTIVNGSLTVVDVTGEVPEVVGTLRLAPELAVRDLFMHGDTVVLMGNTWGNVPVLRGRAVSESDAISSDAVGIVAPDYYGTPVVTLTEVDIADEPEVTRTLQVDGAYLSSRMIDGVARVAISSSPTGFVWVYPEGGGLKAERAAVVANQKIIKDSTIENWVPYYVLSDASGEVIREGTALPCNRAQHPAEFAGFNMLSVMTIDLATGLDIIDSTGVLATGETLYSSADAMYVATNAWFDPRVFEAEADAIEVFDGARTQIHQFDMTGRTTEYVATGAVRGYLLNQFAMSEHNGDLRVASTTAPNWWGFEDGSEESIVSVLRPRDGELELIGSVDGLGKDERIYSIRFLGDVAYLVTFRQVDPLFTIDLSDPTSPEVRGELKIPGYSAYLHPLSDTLILGIGQDATSEGRVLGSQVSLFDVSDLDNPERIAKLSLGRNSNSTAEYDHRAFLHWGDTVVVPLTEYNWEEDGKDSFFTGAVAIDTSDRDLREITRLVHPDGESRDHGWNAAILRSVVVDEGLYTISNLGIMRSDFDGFDSSSWVAFSVR